MLETAYSKLRELCLSEELQAAHPDWPFPLLFQGEEISRDIFFLDLVIEYQVIKLGRNPIQDLAYFRYSSLNRWFHYCFFNGISPIVYSSESLTLLPRLYRLKRVLLQSVQDSSLAGYFQREFALSEPQKLAQSLIVEVSKLIEISSQHKLLVWGARLDAASVQAQAQYLAQVTARISTDLVLGLPHIHRHTSEWKQALNKELVAYRKADARVNKIIKHQKKFHQNASLHDDFTKM